ncbi:MAG TPA: dipicolinate synthase subunit B [Firmicutes bacterium]|nr:dipicolinate synthase subunit B [Bacillota bacterium]
MRAIKAGFAMCGSFCTFDRAIEQMRILKEKGVDIIPIMSENAAFTDTRFGTSEHFRNLVRDITGKDIITEIKAAEPIGPKKMMDILIVAPCTGNTLGKIAMGINDTCVTMAVKSHLRNGRPVLLNVSTNDALGACAKNIGFLLNCKNIYFVPMRQDDPIKKPRSIVSDFTKIEEAMHSALDGIQIQPIITQ